MKHAIAGVVLLSALLGGLPQAQAAPDGATSEVKEDIEKINALAILLGQNLDKRDESPCPSEDFLIQAPRGLRCGIDFVWFLPGSELNNGDISYIMVELRGYFVYRPRANGSTDMGDLIKRKALYTDKEVHRANNLATMYRALVAVRKLRESIEAAPALPFGK